VAEGLSTAFIVIRTGLNLASNVSVDYAVIGGTATNGVDFTLASGQLVFGAGITAAKIPVPTLQDTLAEGAETVLVRLSNPLGGATLGPRTDITLTIRDNDQGGVIRFRASTLRVRETPGGPFTIPVLRTGLNLASNVSVDYAVIGGTATNGADYVLANGTLTFGAGQAAASIPVTILDDALPDGDETLIVGLSNPGGGAALGSLTTLTVTIADNEPALYFTAAAYQVLEGVAFAAITVTRSGPVTTQVTVVCHTVPGGTAVPSRDYRDVVRLLTFAPTVRTQTCRVPVLDDTLVDGPRTVHLRLANPTGPGAQLGPTTVAVLTINDND
jgi:hypothetical protein